MRVVGIVAGSGCNGRTVEAKEVVVGGLGAQLLDGVDGFFESVLGHAEG